MQVDELLERTRTLLDLISDTTQAPETKHIQGDRPGEYVPLWTEKGMPLVIGDLAAYSEGLLAVIAEQSRYIQELRRSLAENAELGREFIAVIAHLDG